MINWTLRCAAIGALSIAAQAADFSYFMLQLNWTPNSCVQPGGPKDPLECGPGRRLGFVLRGLSPQTDQGTGPVRCAPARPLPADVVRTMLEVIPSESTIRREWTDHGTCSDLGPAEYFALARQLGNSIRIPRLYEDVRQPLRMPPQNIGNDFAQTNPGIPREGIRVSCYASGLLEGMRICFDKKGIARPCTGMAECTMITIGLAPMQPPQIR